MTGKASKWRKPFSAFRKHALKKGFSVESEEDGLPDGSEVEFRVAEIPGWKFGVEFRDGPLGIVGTFFWQPDELIDEFVPDESAGCFSVDVIFENGDFTFYRLDMAMGFTKDEPALSYCRALYAYDWEYHYLTREEAERAMAESKAKEAEERAKWQTMPSQG